MPVSCFKARIVVVFIVTQFGDTFAGVNNRNRSNATRSACTRAGIRAVP